MIILAITQKGYEFCYNAKSARRVNPKKADQILEIVNKYRFQLKNDNEIWHAYDICKYDVVPYSVAPYQQFTMDKYGIVKARGSV